MSIFNTSFFICLGISILLVGCIYLYFNSKLSEQDQKITAMFDIITTMINTRPDPTTSLPVKVNEPDESSRLKNGGGSEQCKITVSDNEEEEEEEEKEETDDEFSDDDSDSSSVVYDANTLIFETNIPRFLEEGEGEEGEKEKEKRNIIVEEGVKELLPEPELFDINTLDDIKIINFEEDQSLPQPNEIINDVEVVESIQEQYKKMNLGKLRSIVLEKGLAPDTSKMKKVDLLKLLSPDI